MEAIINLFGGCCGRRTKDSKPTENTPLIQDGTSPSVPAQTRPLSPTPSELFRAEEEECERIAHEAELQMAAAAGTRLTPSVRSLSGGISAQGSITHSPHAGPADLPQDETFNNGDDTSLTTRNYGKPSTAKSSSSTRSTEGLSPLPKKKKVSKFKKPPTDW